MICPAAYFHFLQYMIDTDKPLHHPRMFCHTPGTMQRFVCAPIGLADIMEIQQCRTEEAEQGCFLFMLALLQAERREVQCSL